MMDAVISSTAIFACSDIEATLAYYKDVLGFDSTWTWGDPPTFGSASRGGVTIMFNLQPELAAKVGGHQHWIKVDDADGAYHRHLAGGARIVSEIEDKPWGVREYVVEDLNGYHMRFGGPVSSSPPKSEPFPEGVTIERRKPAHDEFVRVAGAAFGYKDVSSGEMGAGILGRTWNGVVARSPGSLPSEPGEAVGVLRIMQDAPGWFSIWDVAVLPDWQAHGIGTKMMEAALAMIQEASPGAIVYLFTYKHGFYERLGFGMETVSMRRL